MKTIPLEKRPIKSERKHLDLLITKMYEMNVSFSIGDTEGDIVDVFLDCSVNSAFYLGQVYGQWVAEAIRKEIYRERV